MPRPTCFIIFSICLRICRTWFTCWTVVPLPAAMRARRGPLMISGFRRSAVVMERTIASTRPSCALVHVHTLELLAHPRDHPEDALHRAHLAHHLVGLQEVLEREAALHEPLLERGLLVLLRCGLRALDEGEDVAHPEDPGGHAVGVEVLELVELLAGRGELHGLVRDRLDGERRTAARVAVELRQDDAVEVDPLRERLGDGDRVLAGHGVEDEEDVVRLQLLADGGELVHELLVDVEPAGGVDDEDVAPLRAGLVEALLRHLDRVLRRAVEVDRDLDLLAELLELVDRGRALEVGGHERRRLPFLAEEQRELGRRGRLPRALQAGEENDRRRTAGERELGASLAHDRGQLVVDDLHDLLPRA